MKASCFILINTCFYSVDLKARSMNSRNANKKYVASKEEVNRNVLETYNIYLMFVKIASIH